MTSKQKHYIIGALVLVACSVLIVPMFFQTQDEFSPWLWLSSRIPRSPVVVEPLKPQSAPLPRIQKVSPLAAKAWVVTISLEMDLEHTQASVQTLQQQGFPAFIVDRNPGVVLIGPEVTVEDATALLQRLPPELRKKAKVTPFDPGFEL